MLMLIIVHKLSDLCHPQSVPREKSELNVISSILKLNLEILKKEEEKKRGTPGENGWNMKLAEQKLNTNISNHNKSVYYKNKQTHEQYDESQSNWIDMIKRR